MPGSRLVCEDTGRTTTPRGSRFHAVARSGWLLYVPATMTLTDTVRADRSFGATVGGGSSLLGCIVTAWRAENYDLDHGRRGRNGRRVRLLEPDDLALGGDLVAVQDEQHVVPRRGVVRRARRCHVHPGRRAGEAQGVGPLAGVERVGDRPDVDPADLSHLRCVRGGDRERLSVANA